MHHKSYHLLEDTLLEGDTLGLEGDILGLEGDILDLDILVVVGYMVEDTETELNLLKIKKKSVNYLLGFIENFVKKTENWIKTIKT